MIYHRRGIPLSSIVNIPFYGTISTKAHAVYLLSKNIIAYNFQIYKYIACILLIDLDISAVLIYNINIDNKNK